MKSFSYEVKDKLGIHARPAGLLVKCVKESGSAVQIKKEDKTVDASRLMAVMGLGVKCGHTVDVTVEGGNEEAAFELIKKFFEENL